MNYLIVCLAIVLAVFAARLAPQSKKERAKQAAVVIPMAPVCDNPESTPPQNPGQG